MVDKGDFVPLACSRQAQSIAELFNQAPRFDGTYATVVIKDLRTVFKATCCSQTNLLLEALWQQKTAILALPMVFNKLPFEMSCQDGLRYQVWEIERLFDEPRSVAAYSALFSCRCIKRGSAQVSYSRQDVNELRKVLAAVQSDVRQRWLGKLQAIFSAYPGLAFQIEMESYPGHSLPRRLVCAHNGTVETILSTPLTPGELAKKFEVALQN